MNKIQRWQLQDAKARFSEFLDASLNKGPQVVTRRGIEAAVLIPIQEWRRLREAAKPSIKELLLNASAVLDGFPLPRRKFQRRPAIRF